MLPARMLFHRTLIEDLIHAGHFIRHEEYTGSKRTTTSLPFCRVHSPNPGKQTVNKRTDECQVAATQPWGSGRNTK